MVGKIIKIEDMKSTINPGQRFKRVFFKVADPSNFANFQWAKTDLVSSYRNYARWKDLLEVGNIINGISLKDPRTVDADCFPVFIRNDELQKEDLLKIRQLELGLKI